MAGVVVIALWIAALVVMTAALWREVSVLEQRVAVAGLRIIDGPEIGTYTPRELRQDDALYLFISDHCPACLAVLQDMARAGVPKGVRIRAVPFAPTGEGTAYELLSELPELDVVDADRAQSIIEALAIRATPLAVGIRDGMVVSKGYLRHLGDVVQLAAPVFDPHEGPRDSTAAALVVTT